MAPKRGKRNQRNKQRQKARSARAARKPPRTKESFESDFVEAAPHLQHAHDSLRSADPRPFLHILSAFVAIGHNHADELPPMRAKLDELRADLEPLSNALIVGMAQLGGTAEDRAHAASLATTMTIEEKNELPRWLFEIGNTTITSTGTSADVWWDDSSCFLQLDVAGYPVTLAAGFDQVDGYKPVGAFAINSTWDEFDADLCNNVPDEEAYVAIDPSNVALRFATGLGLPGTPDAHAEADTRDAIIDDADLAPWPDVRPLFEWAIRLAGLPADLHQDEDEFVRLRLVYDPSFQDLRGSVDELAAEFRATSFGRAAFAAGIDVHENLEDLIWFGVSDGHGRPTKWGNLRVHKFLVRWSHDLMLQPPDQVVGLPDLLQHWIQYAHEREGLDDLQRQKVLHELVEVTPLFRAQLDNRVAAMFTLLEELDITDELIESEFT